MMNENAMNTEMVNCSREFIVSNESFGVAKIKKLHMQIK